RHQPEGEEPDGVDGGTRRLDRLAEHVQLVRIAYREEQRLGRAGNHERGPQDLNQFPSIHSVLLARAHPPSGPHRTRILRARLQARLAALGRMPLAAETPVPLVAFELD